MIKFECYWTKDPDWTYFKDGELCIKDTAPQEAKDSFQKYLKEKELYYKRQEEHLREVFPEEFTNNTDTAE